MTTIWPGKPYPLGATWDGQGVNFALFSEQAVRVELCLFDSPEAPNEYERIALPEQTDQVWHVYIPGIQPGQLYGYRVYGLFNPMMGLHFNPAKLLVDPYARALAGTVRWHDAIFSYADRDGMVPDERDSAPYVPRSVVIDPAFDWGNDRAPQIPLHRSLIYELHIKGFTKQHPEVPEHLRGTYAGLASPSVIAYLQSIGVTAVELLPIHSIIDERPLFERGLRNYWGYNTLNYFAPDARYSSCGNIGDQVREFKEMVKGLHAAGIEVILDVVYNHTGEGSHLGPTLSMRGIDNRAYYRLVRDNPFYYMDYTGCGNSLNMLHSRTLQLIMDSLRYWVLEMHVDGFRFDLASTLARGLYDGDRLSAFFDIIHQDPVLSQVKLIAEPWDVGPGGYQVGNFPVLWAEWNGKYRDTVRRFWKGDEAHMAELAYRLTGSSDLYRHNGRRPYASINFITSHDGFTLRDLVSYNHKHNIANGENNRDGENNNNSWNSGAEGPTDDPAIIELRLRQQRNLLATMMLSQGVPMLLAGDERNRTQHGNNNAYCQDNQVGWVDWWLDEHGQQMLEWVRLLMDLRRDHPALHRRKFFQGRAIHGHRIRDIEWFCPNGTEMSDSEWSHGTMRCLGMRLNGQVMNEWDEHGNHIRDDILLLLINGYNQEIPFILPGQNWEILLDSASPRSRSTHLEPGRPYALHNRSIALLRQPAPVS